MIASNRPDLGLQRLIEKLRQEFQKPENLDFYTGEDLKEAERKYIKFCLFCGTRSSRRQTHNGKAGCSGRQGN